MAIRADMKYNIFFTAICARRKNTVVSIVNTLELVNNMERTNDSGGRANS